MFDLVAARYVEPFAMVLAEIAYSGSNNGKLVYRFEHFHPAGPSALDEARPSSVALEPFAGRCAPPRRVTVVDEDEGDASPARFVLTRRDSGLRLYSPLL